MHSKGELLKKVNAGTSKKLNINCIASKLNILTNCTFLFVSQRFSSTSSSKNGDVLTGLCTWNRGLHKVKGFTARKTMLTVKFWKFIFRNGQGLRREFHFRRVANLTSWKFFLYSIRFWNWKMITYWKEKIFFFSKQHVPPNFSFIYCLNWPWKSTKASHTIQTVTAQQRWNLLRYWIR